MNRFVLASCLAVAASPDFAEPVSPAARTEVVQNTARLLETRYVHPDEGRRLAKRLRKAEQRWAGITDPEIFAQALTHWLRDEGKDGHLGLTYSRTAIPENGGDAAITHAEMLRWYGPQLNHGVEKIERHEGNIMLLDLRIFPPAQMGADVIAAAMNVVAQGDALIIDLRRNGGGGETVNLMTGYLLDEPGQPLSGMYDRPTDKHRPSVSPAWVPGAKFGGKKPLYILTSKRTFSAAEAFAYDLQALGRAVIVGERSGGGAHPFEYRRVSDHFAFNLPESRSVNPITGSNWQGVGVKPDVEVPADQALERALSLARRAVARQGD